MATETFEKKFTVGSAASLEVSNISGSIDLRAGDDDQVHVTAVKRGSTRSVENTRVDMDQDTNGRLSIKVRAAHSIMGIIKKNGVCDVDLVIEAPKSSIIAVSIISGTISAEGFDNWFDCRGVSADLRLKNVQGKVKAKSVSGEITGIKLSSVGEFESISGDMELSDCSFSSVICNTVSGDIDLQGGISGEPATFKTVSGDISIQLDTENAHHFVAKSLSGMIQFPNSADVRRVGLGDYIGETNGGGTTIRINSLSGNIKIDSDQGERTQGGSPAEMAPVTT